MIPDNSTVGAGQYTIDLSNAVPESQNGSGDSVFNLTDLVEPRPNFLKDTVAFLFKFEELYSRNVSYKWVVS